MDFRVKGERRRQVVDFTGCVGLTDQTQAASCDINRILAQYVQTETMDHLASGQGSYADVYDALDYRDALEVIRNAQAVYDDLPDVVKRRCRTPEEFLVFAGDPANQDEMVKLGLANAKPASVVEGTSPAPLPT